MNKPAFVDELGMFHCPCGNKHARGALDGVDLFRCFGCGSTYRVRGVAELRQRPTVTAGDLLDQAQAIQRKLVAACELAHDAIGRSETPGSHKQRDMQFVLDKLAEAIEAGGGKVHPVPVGHKGPRG